MTFFSLCQIRKKDVIGNAVSLFPGNFAIFTAIRRALAGCTLGAASINFGLLSGLLQRSYRVDGKFLSKCVLNRFSRLSLVCG
jgi:hypothetical protein